MKRMLVVVFDDESKAYQGSRALRQLDSEGSIAIYAEAVIKKSADGTVTVKQADDDLPIRTVAGTAIGSLIGLLEGPVGVAVGATAGLLAGSIGDLHVAGVDAEFLGDVAAKLASGKCAVIADVNEEWVTPVDTRMEPLGGTVLRTLKRTFEHDQWASDVAAMRADIDQLKAELATAHADRKAKLQAQIDKAESKLQAKLDQIKQRSEQAKRETEAKVKALQKKAETAHGERKAALEGWIKKMRQQDEESDARIKHLLATKLKAAAARLEK